MADWKSTFRIDDIWHKRNGECGAEDWTDKTVHELAKEIARRIKKKWRDRLIDGDNVDFCLCEVYDLFHELPTYPEYTQKVKNVLEDDDASDDEVSYVVEMPPMREFNEGMSMFYDWCDRNLVWVNK